MASSGIIKSYTRPAGSTGENAHWSFEWTSTKKSAGVTTVSWNLYTRGRYSSPTWLVTGCWLDMTANGTTTRLYSGDGFDGSENSFKDKWRASGSFDVKHSGNGDGSFQINFEVYIYAYAHKTSSAIATLDPNYTMAQLTWAPNFDDESNPTITYNNPAGTSATSVQACITKSPVGTNPTIAYRDISKTGTNYTFNLTDAERNTLRNLIKDANSMQLNFFVKTEIDGSTFYSAKPVTFSIINANPTITATARDINMTTYELTGDNTKYVRYFSNVHVDMTAQAKKGASIVTSSGAGTYYNVETDTFNCYAKDTRGNAVTYPAKGTLVPYVKLTCNLGNERPDANGNFDVRASGNYFNANFGAIDNTLTVEYRYKERDGSWSTYRTMSVTKSGNTYDASATITGLNYQKQYIFEVIAQDKLMIARSPETAYTAVPVFDWGEEDFNFNVPVTINGNLVVNGLIECPNAGGSNPEIAPAADFIIEQGTKTTGSGNSTANWVYRKWNSGIAECWCRKHVSTAVNTAWGNLYVSGALSYTNITWGVSFIDIPVANITIAPNASGAFLIAGGSTSLTATNTGGYEIARGSALASAGNFYINYYAIGKWK